jgi:hypothetical protein
VRELYPGCPPRREVAIAEHAYLKYSGRVGRSAAAENLGEQALRLVVGARIHHVEMAYDSPMPRASTAGKLVPGCRTKQIGFWPVGRRPCNCVVIWKKSSPRDLPRLDLSPGWPPNA